MSRVEEETNMKTKKLPVKTNVKAGVASGSVCASDCTCSIS